MRDLARLAAALLLLLLPGSLRAQEAERRAMLEKSGPSVVAIRNSESYGSGMILDDKGTILTSAHVIVSPLPYRVEAQFKENGTVRTAYFTKVVLIGVHPTHDLAIIRIDPSEHKAVLTPLPIAKNSVVSTDLVYAIGFPSSHGGLQKICTTGEVTGVNQFVDMPGYFSVSADIHPGNSGGPIVDPRGNAVGVVTFGARADEPQGWAIPLNEFRPDKFVPMDRRPADPASASTNLRYAEAFLKRAKKGGRISGLLADEFFSQALLYDVTNSDIYFKIGMIKRNYEEYPAAAAYLMRSLQIQPWSDSEDLYNELGIALVKLGKKSDAVAIWSEGIAKFPGAGKIWDALAICHYEDARFYDAACATRASLRGFGPRTDAMNGMYDQCRRRLSPEDLTRLSLFEKSIESRAKDAQTVSERARRAGTRFLTPAAEATVKAFEGVQKEATNFNFSSLGRGPNAPKPLDIPDEHIVPLFIRSRIGVATEHLHAGRFDAAVEILEDVLKTYPDHPEAEPAKDLLRLIKKSR